MLHSSMLDAVWESAWQLKHIGTTLTMTTMATQFFTIIVKALEITKKLYRVQLCKINCENKTIE